LIAQITHGRDPTGASRSPSSSSSTEVTGGVEVGTLQLLQSAFIHAFAHVLLQDRLMTTEHRIRSSTVSFGGVGITVVLRDPIPQITAFIGVRPGVHGGLRWTVLLRESLRQRVQHDRNLGRCRVETETLNQVEQLRFFWTEHQLAIEDRLPDAYGELMRIAQATYDACKAWDEANQKFLAASSATA
jgi:hypothetical protein